MKNTVLVFTILLAFFSCANAQRVYIYRNNNTFDFYDLDQSLSIKHNINNTSNSISISANSSERNIPLIDIDSCVIRSNDFPTLRFTFPDNPELTWVNDKNNYIDATLSIDGHGVCDDVQSTELSVKGRGNSSWSFPKKPMRMKFKSKISICGLKKAKSFVLLADFLDNSLMRNATALWLAKRIGLPYANGFMPCLVYVNDRLAGYYLITEKIGISGASVDIDEETGVLMELSTEYDEKYKFRTRSMDLPTMIKDPDFDELYESDPMITPTERLAAWEDDFNKAVDASNTASAFDYFDLDTFVKYMLVYDFAQNDEVGWPKSVYCYKTALGTEAKYHFGPVWDFDVAFNLPSIVNGQYEERASDNSLWGNSLFFRLSTRPEFVEAFKNCFDEFEKEIFPELLEWFDEYSNMLEPLAKIDGALWSESYDYKWVYRVPSFDHKAKVARMRQWMIDRVAFIRQTVDRGVPFD